MVIWVVDSDAVMALCIKRAIGSAPNLVIRSYHNAIDAINGLAEGVPDLIFLEIRLVGPDGFTLLNELMSYDDTAQVPVVLVTDLPLTGRDLAIYGVVGILLKETMKPVEIRRYVERFTGVGSEISAYDFSANRE